MQIIISGEKISAEVTELIGRIVLLENAAKVLSAAYQEGAQNYTGVMRLEEDYTTCQNKLKDLLPSNK